MPASAFQPPSRVRIGPTKSLGHKISFTKGMMVRDPLNEKIAEQLMIATGGNLDEQIAGPTNSDFEIQ